jgi:uncharacterized small protein (DUF1192 family)
MATSAELAAQIEAYDKSKKSSADILNEAMTRYGVPEIRQRVSGLRTTLGNTEAALNAVDPSVTGRTSRSLVTEAQRQRMVANERAPIAQQYGEQSGALTTESSNLTDAERAAQTLAQGNISDYTTGRSALQNQYESAYAREQNALQQAEATRQYNETLAEQKRQANLSSGSSSGIDLSGIISSILGGNGGYTATKDERGGLQFASSGTPITAAQYAKATGNTILSVLSKSSNPTDKQIINDINSGMSYEDLSNKYPYVFGGV